MARAMEVEGFSEALIREDAAVQQFFMVLVSCVGSGVSNSNFSFALSSGLLMETHFA